MTVNGNNYWLALVLLIGVIILLGSMFAHVI